MRYFFGILLIVTVFSTSCSKTQSDCNVVTITGSAMGCGGWGIKVGEMKYPSGNIPDEFKQEGLVVCANYELYQDLRLCACCGGIWANIKTIKKMY